jgi:hypothetical protein
MSTAMAKPLRWLIAEDVLERAKDAGDAHVADACRRAIRAWMLGRKADAADTAIIRAFAE